MNDHDIRSYFSQYGPLAQIHLSPPRQKALLTYRDHDSASRAWNDPSPVFNNRFVKIFWKRPDPGDADSRPGTGDAGSGGTGGVGQGGSGSGSGIAQGELSGRVVDEVELEVAREAARKAQREHEEKVRRKEELERRKEELERKRVELMERQKGERERLLEKIRRAKEKKAQAEGKGEKQSSMEAVEMKNKTETTAGKVDVSNEDEGKVNGEDKSGEEEKISQEPQKDENNDDSGTKSETNGDAAESSRKAHLQKMLSELQNQVPTPPCPIPNPCLTSQAKALNIPPSEYTLPALSSPLPRTKTFRGGYRGRPYQERGGRGRGRGGTSSRSLDLRPRSILVPGIIGTEKETAIREWLVVNSGEAVCETLDGDTGKGMVVKFKERYEAEEVCTTLLSFPMWVPGMLRMCL